MLAQTVDKIGPCHGIIPGCDKIRGCLRTCGCRSIEPTHGLRSRLRCWKTSCKRWALWVRDLLRSCVESLGIRVSCIDFKRMVERSRKTSSLFFISWVRGFMEFRNFTHRSLSLLERHVRSRYSRFGAGAASAFDSRPANSAWQLSRLQLVGIETLCHPGPTWNSSGTNHMFGGSNLAWWFGFSIFVGHCRWCSPHLHHHSCLASVCLRSRPVSERGLHTVDCEREHLQLWELFLETRRFHVCCCFEDMAYGLCTVVSTIYDHR